MPETRRLSKASMSKPPPTGSKESSLDALSLFRVIVDTSLSVMDENENPQLQKSRQLHEQLIESSSTLDSLKTFLNSFEGDLKSLSREMEELHTRSQKINSELEVRRQVNKTLSPFVEALIMPPQVVRQLSEGDIASPQGREALVYVVQKQRELKRMTQEAADINKRAADEPNGDHGNDQPKQPEEGDSRQSVAVQPGEPPQSKTPFLPLEHVLKSALEQLELVIDRALERTRDYITSRIKQIRVYGVNVQWLQYDLINNKELFTFVKSQNKQLADDFKRAYTLSMAWYYHLYFGRYIHQLLKLKLHVVDKTVLLGSAEDTSRRGLFSLGSTSTSLQSEALLSLGLRGNVISSDDPSVMLASVAADSQQTHWLEVGFRSLNIALTDNCAAEYQTLTEVFGVHGEEANHLFNQIFEPTFRLAQMYTQSLIENSYDAYGILICIRLSRKLEYELQHRKVPGMETYLQATTMQLWPRFQYIIDCHCDSLRRASTRATAFSNTSALVPHHLTQLFSQFLSGILGLCDDQSDAEPVGRSMQRLQVSFESFLTKVSSVLDNDKREKFLFNNYSLLATVLEGGNKLAEAQKEHFQLLVDAYSKK